MRTTLKRGTTLSMRKQQTSNTSEDTNLFRQKMIQMQNIQDPYIEKPRGNLYSVIKNLRECVDGYKHVMIVVKMNELEQRGDTEVELRKMYSRFQFEGETIIGNMAFGLVVVVGPYHIALLESRFEEPLDIILSGINQIVQTTSLYEQAWVLFQTEEVKDEHFREFNIRQIQVQQAAKEIKNYSQIERIQHLYSSLAGIGYQSVQMELQSKQAANIQKYIKETAQETIPAGSELASALPEVLTVEEWAEYADAPDIVLEKEMAWPTDPELIY